MGDLHGIETPAGFQVVDDAAGEARHGPAFALGRFLVAGTGDRHLFQFCDDGASERRALLALFPRSEEPRSARLVAQHLAVATAGDIVGAVEQVVEDFGVLRHLRDGVAGVARLVTQGRNITARAAAYILAHNFA